MLCVINTHDTHMLPYIACLVAEELNVLGDSQERTVAGTQQRVVPIHVSHVPWWPAALVGIERSANPDLRWKRLIFFWLITEMWQKYRLVVRMTACLYWWTFTTNENWNGAPSNWSWGTCGTHDTRNMARHTHARSAGERAIWWGESAGVGTREKLVRLQKAALA